MITNLDKAALDIRPVEALELSVLLELIKELAEYEDALDSVLITAKDLHYALFGPVPRLFAEIARWSGEVAGYVAGYDTFSTFAGRSKILIEDLYVRRAFRGIGIGKSLIARVCERCTAKDFIYVQWRVLGWNETAIGFYRAIGADVSDKHLNCTLSGAALCQLTRTRGRSNRNPSK